MVLRLERHSKIAEAGWVGADQTGLRAGGTSLE